jgi:ABC-type transport system substrate-binding protein
MFFLRPNVVFHNGAPFNADAVVSTLETIAKRATRPRGLDPGTAKAVANDQVEIDLTVPNGRLAEQLASPTMGMVAPGTVAGGGGSDPAMIPTGTGPFQFVSYTPGATLAVKAFDRYWGTKPQLRTITFRFGAETDTGRLLATRQVDMAGLVPYAALPAVSGRTDHFVGSPAGRAEYLLLNNGGIDDYAILKDANVRQAIGLAIDRRAVQKTAWPDDGADNATVIPSIVMEDTASQVKTPDQNPAQAKRLLDQAGWLQGSTGVRTKGGKPLVLTLILARPSEQQAAAKVVVAQLAAVGITVNIVDPTPDTPFVRVNNATFDLFMASQPQDDGNPCALCRFFSIRPGGQLSYASSVGGGQMADDFYDMSYASATIDAARGDAAGIMNIVIAQKFTAVPLASLRTEWLISPRVQAFPPAALGGTQRWDTVWLSV